VKVNVLNRAGRPLELAPARAFLRRLDAVLQPPSGELNVLFCGDEEMRELNLTWLGKDRPTDVLSFPGGGATAEGRVHLGDLAISLETASRQARRARRPLSREIETLLAHGLLHLLGFDHETDDGTMMRLQAEALRRARAPHGSR